MNYRIGSFKIAQWIIHPDLNRISGPNGEEIVGPRIMQLLVFLAQQEGNVVTREDLLTHVWDDVHVNEESITKSISILRNAFERTSENVTVIETIRSVGYRLVLPVEFDIISTGKKSKVSGWNHFSIRSSYAQFGIGILLVACFIVVYAFDVFVFDNYSEPVAISRLPGPERVPRISPDGKKVVFAWDGPGAVNYDIFIRNIETSELIQLTSGEALDTDPVWSPDGQYIAFYRNDGRSVSIQSINIKTGFTNRVANAHFIPNLSALSWSNDGKYIVFSDKEYQRDPFSLYMLNYETGRVTKLTHPKQGIVGDVSPRFSKGDRYLAFIRGTTSSELYGHIIPAIGDVFVLDLETDIVKQVTYVNTEISGLDWEADDQTLLFSSIANNFTFLINKLDLKEESVVTLYETNNIIRNLSSNRKSSLMTYEEWQEEVVLKKLDLNDASFVGVNYMSNSGRQWYPQLNKKETHLAYVSIATGASELWIKDLESDTDRQVTSLKGPVIYTPKWSPNGEWITFCTEDKVGTQVHIVSTVIGEPEIKTLFSEPEESNCVPNWSEDGRSIYFRSRMAGSLNVWRADFSQDYERIVDTTKVLNASTLLIEQKGHRLYYTRTDANGIWQFDLETQKDSLVLSQFNRSDWANWELNRGNIYYYKRDEYGRAVLMRYNIDTQIETKLHSFLVNLPSSYAGFSYNNSENSIIFSSIDNVSSEVMLLNFR